MNATPRGGRVHPRFAFFHDAHVDDFQPEFFL
jgi:hypothetical protein